MLQSGSRKKSKTRNAVVPFTDSGKTSIVVQRTQPSLADLVPRILILDNGKCSVHSMGPSY
jgi:hypothetical protein